MAAYMVIYAKITDADQFQLYANVVGPLLAKYHGKLIGRGTPPTSLEGDWPWMTAGILEFPSAEAIQAFWSSPEYVEAKKLREGAAEFQALLVNQV